MSAYAQWLDSNESANEIFELIQPYMRSNLFCMAGGYLQFGTVMSSDGHMRRYKMAPGDYVYVDSNGVSVYRP